MKMVPTPQARQFAEGIHAKFPGKLLAYNCSPSFNWQKNLSDSEIATFQQVCSRLAPATVRMLSPFERMSSRTGPSESTDACSSRCRHGPILC